MTAYSCPTCGHSLQGQVATFEVRQRIALHRQEHERVERRRAQWRDSARRRRLAKLHPDQIGSLHNLGCGGQHRKGKNGCVPIPVYDHPITAPGHTATARMGTSRVELRDARIPSGLPVVLNPLPGGRSASSRLRR